jgi:glutamyl-Q tRNA(Asp) synthetase
MIVTRFAPSPTGYLHLGHAYSAITAWRYAQKNAGRFLLRIEDIDPARCRPEFVHAIYEDLHWLGVTWENPVRVQSAHFADYQNALADLQARDLIYPCFCTRREIAAEIARSPSAPHGTEGSIYPGTCKNLSGEDVAAKKLSGMSFAWRLHTDRAMAFCGPLPWLDALAGEIIADPLPLGDVVLARKEMPASYHLSVVIDDGLQGVTDIIRGDDLFAATHLHILLQKLLKYQTPRYHHHPLITDTTGKKFSKRDGAVTLRALRASGKTPADIFQMVGLA